MTNEDTYPNKDRASGYVDEDGRSIGESLVNRVTELMIAPQTKMLQLAAHLDETRIVQDQRFGYILNQFSAFLEKEDTRHSAYDDVLERGEAANIAALTSVAQRLDEITALVQQGIATGVKALVIGEKALAVGEKALGVSESNAKRLRHVEKRFVEVEKTVMALKKGQAASDEQAKKVLQDIAELREEIAALREAAKEAARLAEEHTRLTEQTAELDRRVALIEAWQAALEARAAGKPDG